MKLIYHIRNVYGYDENYSLIWESQIHYRLKVVLWRFVKCLITTRDRICLLANLKDVSCPLHSVLTKNDLHIMSKYDIIYHL